MFNKPYFFHVKNTTHYFCCSLVGIGLKFVLKFVCLFLLSKLNWSSELTTFLCPFLSKVNGSSELTTFLCLFLRKANRSLKSDHKFVCLFLLPKKKREF